jgi:hypothetical protein
MSQLVRLSVLILLVWCSVLTTIPVNSSAQEKVIRLGIIGLDTSHVTAFTQTLNDPTRPDHVRGARVVAAFKGGSPDVESSATRIDKFTAELRDKWNVELVSSIEELCQKVDAVLLESVDGRPHLAQVRPVFAARKPVFIDKPFAGNLKDAKEIVRLARESGTPFFSSSSLRFIAEFQAARKSPEIGEIVGAVAWSPAPTEAHHPDLFWYGIHGVETLYTLMGTGCESVTRTFTNGTDVVTGRWKDGRIGTFRGLRDGAKPYGAMVFGSKAVQAIQPKVDYRGLIVEIVKFFQTGVPPVSPEETLEIMAFMEAADLSKVRSGAAVSISELLGK